MQHVSRESQVFLVIRAVQQQEEQIEARQQLHCNEKLVSVPTVGRTDEQLWQGNAREDQGHEVNERQDNLKQSRT